MIRHHQAGCLAVAILLASLFPGQAVAELPPPNFLSQVDSLRVEGRNGEALELVEGVLPEAREKPDEDFLLELLARQGSCLTLTGRSAAAVPVLDEVVKMAEARGDSVIWCEGLRWGALARDMLGRPGEARELYENLLTLAAAAGKLEYMGWAQVGMGWQDFRSGRGKESARRYHLAVDHFTAMTETREPCPERCLIWAWNGVGLAEQSLGNFDTALQAYQRSASLARSVDQGVGESMAVNNLGSLAFSLGDPGTALEHFVRARDLQIEFQNSRGSVKPALNIVLCHMGLGRYDTAATELDSLAVFCRQHKFVDLEAMVINMQADLAMNRNRPHQAADMFREVLAMPAGLPLKNRFDARIGLGRALSYLDRPEEALAVLETAKEEISGRGSLYQVLLVDAEIALLLQTLDRHREALSLLLQVEELAEESGIAGFKMRALARAAASCRSLDEPDRALAFLQEAALDWEQERNLPLNPEWREQRGLAGRHVFTDLAVMILKHSPEPDPDRRQDLAFDQLQRFKARTLLERLFGPGQAITSVEAPDPIDLADLQGRVLADGELFLDFYCGPEVSLLFAVTARDCRVVALPAEEDLANQVKTFGRMLSNPPQTESAASTRAVLGDAGTALRDLLFSDLADMIAASRLVFYSPDGVLNLLPPAALETAASGPAWSRVPSATVLGHLREERLNPDDPPGCRVLALVGETAATDEPLAGAVYESARLGRRFKDVEVRTCRADTTGSAAPITLSGLVEYEVLHLATHTSLDDESPWQSSILLPGFGYQGRLTASRIASATMNARLVVLAACGSASGRVLSGEGVLGLTSAFISAGAPAVVATLWPVDDAATATIMTHFYDSLAKGNGAAEALQAAREAVRNEPSTAHPFYWAGYLLVGDGQIGADLQPRLPVRSLVLGGLGLVFAALFLFSLRRRP